MSISYKCPTCKQRNSIEVEGVKVEAASCLHCGTELYLITTATQNAVIRS